MGKVRLKLTVITLVAAVFLTFGFCNMLDTHQVYAGSKMKSVKVSKLKKYTKGHLGKNAMEAVLGGMVADFNWNHYPPIRKVKKITKAQDVYFIVWQGLERGAKNYGKIGNEKFKISDANRIASFFTKYRFKKHSKANFHANDDYLPAWRTDGKYIYTEGYADSCISPIKSVKMNKKKMVITFKDDVDEGLAGSLFKVTLKKKHGKFVFSKYQQIRGE